MSASLKWDRPRFSGEKMERIEQLITWMNFFKSTFDQLGGARDPRFVSMVFCLGLRE